MRFILVPLSLRIEDGFPPRLRSYLIDKSTTILNLGSHDGRLYPAVAVTHVGVWCSPVAGPRGLKRPQRNSNGADAKTCAEVRSYRARIRCSEKKGRGGHLSRGRVVKMASLG